MKVEDVIKALQEEADTSTGLLHELWRTVRMVDKDTRRFSVEMSEATYDKVHKYLKEHKIEGGAT